EGPRSPDGEILSISDEKTSNILPLMNVVNRNRSSWDPVHPCRDSALYLSECLYSRPLCPPVGTAPGACPGSRCPPCRDSAWCLSSLLCNVLPLAGTLSGRQLTFHPLRLAHPFPEIPSFTTD